MREQIEGKIPEKRHIDMKYALTMLDILIDKGVKSYTLEDVKNFIMAMPENGRIWFESVAEISQEKTPHNNKEPQVKIYNTAKEAFESLSNGAGYLILCTCDGRSSSRIRYDELPNSEQKDD